MDHPPEKYFPANLACPRADPARCARPGGRARAGWPAGRDAGRASPRRDVDQVARSQPLDVHISGIGYVTASMSLGHYAPHTVTYGQA